MLLAKFLLLYFWKYLRNDVKEIKKIVIKNKSLASSPNLAYGKYNADKTFVTPLTL